MSEAAQCLRRTYVKLNYVPPLQPHVPLHCNSVAWTKLPEIAFTERQMKDPIPFVFLCALPYTVDAGGVIVLLQINARIIWELSFINTLGQMVSENHHVFVSMPMMFNLRGPRIALNAILPWPVKLVGYVGIIAKAFRGLDEVESIFAKILSRQVGFCPKDVKALQVGLKALETEMNHLLQRGAESLDDRKLASRMNFSPFGTGRFAGTRLA